MDEPICDLPGLALSLFLFQRIDQFNGREEANPLAVMFNGLNAQRCGDVGFAGSRSPYQNDIVVLFDEGTGMELAHQGLIDLAAGKIEASQVLVGWKARHLELIGNRSCLPFGHLGLEQLGENRNGCLEGRRPLFGELADRLGHARHLEALEHDDQSCACRIMTHGAPPCPRAGYRSVPHWPAVPCPGQGLVAPRRARSRSICHPPVCAAGSEYGSWWAPRSQGPSQPP